MPALLSRLLQATLILGLFLAGYTLIIAIVLNQAAEGAGTGDRLLIRFDANTSTSEALQSIGGAGAVVQRQPNGRGFYVAELLEPAAAARMREHALIFRIPTEPTLSSCLAAMSD